MFLYINDSVVLWIVKAIIHVTGEWFSARIFKKTHKFGQNVCHGVVSVASSFLVPFLLSHSFSTSYFSLTKKGKQTFLPVFTFLRSILVKLLFLHLLKMKWIKTFFSIFLLFKRFIAFWYMQMRVWGMHSSLFFVSCDHCQTWAIHVFGVWDKKKWRVAIGCSGIFPREGF